MLLVAVIVEVNRAISAKAYRLFISANNFSPREIDGRKPNAKVPKIYKVKNCGKKLTLILCRFAQDQYFRQTLLHSKTQVAASNSAHVLRATRCKGKP